MESHPHHPVLDREVRARILAKGMLRDEVRPKMITSFTRIPRNRLAAMRRRMGLPPSSRPLGRTRWNAAAFVATAERRFESSALAALLTTYGLVEPQPGPDANLDRLDVGERLFELYGYVREFFPQVSIDFDALVLLRTSLRKREVIEISYCEQCHGQIVVERFDRKHRTCWFCTENGGERSVRHDLAHTGGQVLEA